MYTLQSFSLVFTSGLAPHLAQYICIMHTLYLVQYKLFSIHECCAFLRSSSSWPGGRNLRQQVSKERLLLIQNITVDSASAVHGKTDFCSYNLSLHKNTNITQKKTKTITFLLLSSFINITQNMTKTITFLLLSSFIIL